MNVFRTPATCLHACAYVKASGKTFTTFTTFTRDRVDAVAIEAFGYEHIFFGSAGEAAGTPEAPAKQTATMLSRLRETNIARLADFSLGRIATGFGRGFRSTCSPGHAVKTESTGASFLV